MSRWVVTALVEDGGWVPVEVEAETMAEAVDCAFSLDWVENVVECQEIEWGRGPWPPSKRSSAGAGWP